MSRAKRDEPIINQAVEKLQVIMNQQRNPEVNLPGPVMPNNVNNEDNLHVTPNNMLVPYVGNQVTTGDDGLLEQYNLDVANGFVHSAMVDEDYMLVAGHVDEAIF